MSRKLSEIFSIANNWPLWRQPIGRYYVSYVWGLWWRLSSSNSTLSLGILKTTLYKLENRRKFCQVSWDVLFLIFIQTETFFNLCIFSLLGWIVKNLTRFLYFVFWPVLVTCTIYNYDNHIFLHISVSRLVRMKVIYV